MSKEFRNRDKKELTQSPFKKLKHFKVGPICLACSQPITHVKSQRQGWMHDSCEGQKAKEMKDGKDTLFFVPGVADDELGLLVSQETVANLELPVERV